MFTELVNHILSEAREADVNADLESLYSDFSGDDKTNRVIKNYYMGVLDNSFDNHRVAYKVTRNWANKRFGKKQDTVLAGR